MSMSAVERSLYTIFLVCLVLFVTPPVIFADQDREVSARALLGEAEKLIECAVPQDALPVLDRVKTDYPETEAASFAELRRAQCFFFLHNWDSAISTARSIVTNNPGTIIACWAQCCVGQSLVKKGETAAGIVELKKVDGMLPDKKDLGPLNEAREVLGKVLSQYLEGRTDDLDAVEYLGCNRNDTASKAKALAILAGYRAREGSIASAKATVARLASECSSESSEVAWAKTEVALTEVRSTVKDNQESVNVLNSMLTTMPSDDHTGARSALVLAKSYVRKGEMLQAVSILQYAKDKFCGSAKSPEMPQILYDLGNVLCRSGKIEEGLSNLKLAADSAPRSGFAAPALYCIGTYSSTNLSAALEALNKLTSDGYDQSWRGLGFWRLAVLYKPLDKTRSIECYTQAIELFKKCLAEQKADIGTSWRQALETRISLIEAELQDLGPKEQE